MHLTCFSTGGKNYFKVLNVSRAPTEVFDKFDLFLWDFLFVVLSSLKIASLQRSKYFH